jgi:hypothetical protein
MRGTLCAFACVLPAHLGAASTALHAAPVAAAVLARIEKEPAAITEARALLHPLHFLGDQQLHCRAYHRPQHSVEHVLALSPNPLEGMGCWDEPRVRHRLGKSGLQRLEVGWVG